MPRTADCCVCFSSTSEYVSNPDEARVWAAIAACGHIVHEACLKHMWQGKTSAQKQCPICRTTVNSVSKKAPDGLRRRLYSVRLFFPGDMGSDAQSQLPSDPAVAQLGEEDEASDDDDDVARGDDVDENRKLLAEKTMTIRKLKTDLEQLNDRLQRTTTDRDAKQQQILQLEARIAQKDAALEAANDELNEVLEEAEGLREDLEDYEWSDVGELRRRLEWTNDELEAVQRELDETIENHGDVEEVVAEAVAEEQAKHAREKQQLEFELRKARQTIAKEGDSGARRIAHLEKEIERHLTEKEEMVGKVEAAKGGVSKVKQEYEEKLAQARAERDHVNRNFRHLESQLNSLKRAQQSWEARYTKAKEDCAKMEEKYARLQQRKTVVTAEESPSPERGQRGNSAQPPPAQAQQEADAELPTSGQRRRSASPLGFRVKNHHREEAGPSKKRAAPEQSSEGGSDDIEIIDMKSTTPANKKRSIFKRDSPSSEGIGGMPLLASYPAGGARRRSPKGKLTAQPSDRHLPDLAKSLYESGPKVRKKATR